MSTAGKLWLGFGLLLALLIGTGLFVAHRLALIERALLTIMAVQEPATAATYEMAVNVITTRSGVLHYSDSGDAGERAHVRVLLSEFAGYKQRFDQVARSETSRELGRRIDTASLVFSHQADSLMSLSDQEREHSSNFVKRSDEVLELIDPGLRTHLDTRGKDGQRRIIDMGRLETDVHGVGASLRHFMATRDTRHRVRIAFHESHFKVTVSDLRDTHLNDDELARIARIESAFNVYVEDARTMMTVADQQRIAYGRFLRTGDSLERLVDEGIRSLARTDLLEAQQSARRAIRTSLIAVLLLLVAGILIGAGTAIPTGRSIVHSDQNLRERMRELADAHQRKDEFLGVLGHELRNPLAPLTNVLNVLHARSTDVPRDVREHHETMERQVRSMSRLVDELLDVSRINQGKITLKREPVDLARVAAETARDHQLLLDAHHHRLEVVRPPRPAWVHADPTRLSQVTSNLLQNAIKYTPDGGTIVLEVESANGQAVLRVTDNGIGISPAMLPLVFEPFIQGDQSRTRTQGGLGIGLTLVSRLVELHGGRTTVESPGLGQGSTFTVRLPSVSAPEAPVEPPAIHIPSHPRRILVVDDNHDSAESMAILLGIWGHRVEIAHDGRSAIAAAEHSRPEIVFLDIGLPGMDGYEVARRLRAMWDHSSMTLIALTGLGREEDRREALDAGFDRHITKPVTPETLKSIVGTVESEPV
jgi:signal transduction histidine kinase/ActR/RegA family two-component response regulator